MRSVAASRPSGLPVPLVSSFVTYTRLPCTSSPSPPRSPHMPSPPNFPQAEKALSDVSDSETEQRVCDSVLPRKDRRLKRWARTTVHHLKKHTGLGAICAVAYFDPYVLNFLNVMWACTDTRNTLHIQRKLER